MALEDIMEEFFIEEISLPRSFENLDFEKQKDIIQQNSEIFQKRKHKYYKNMKEMGFPFSNKEIKNLLEMGEINLADAIDLGFYLGLNKYERYVYDIIENAEYEACLQKYLKGVQDLGVYLSKQEGHRLIIAGHVASARQYSLKKGLKEDVSNIAKTVLNRDYYLNNACAEMYEMLIETQKIVGKKASISDVYNEVLENSKRAMTIARRIDTKRILTGELNSLAVFETVSILRNNSLSKENKAKLKSSKKDTVRVVSELNHCIEYEL